MNRELLYSFIVFWGIWILIPVLVDGVIALVHITFSWRELWKKRKDGPRDAQLPGFYPQISVVIPVFNSEDTLPECLESIARQTYPLGRVELFLIDNGSTDGSFAVFQKFSEANPDMILRWIKLEEPGKAKALNSGIFLGSSEILINIDSDTKLGPNVLMETVTALFAREEVAGATAAIMIDFSRISKKSLWLRSVQSCELIEYLEAFFIGRKYQAHHNNLFTLAGAFSCFNRKSLLQTFLYDQNSISEDTKLTFELRRKNESKKIGFLENAKVYVEPIPSIKKLYSQRVRWQRGELEVIASYVEHYKGGLFKLARSYAARTLFVDHTLMFPRMVWTILTPLLVFFGYPLELIILANFFVYLVYLFIDINYLLIAYRHVGEEYKDYLKNNGWRVIFMPLYRFLVFWFRAAGAIHAVTEKAIWTVDDPVNQTLKAVRKQWLPGRRKHEKSP